MKVSGNIPAKVGLRRFYAGGGRARVHRCPPLADVDGRDAHDRATPEGRQQVLRQQVLIPLAGLRLELARCDPGRGVVTEGLEHRRGLSGLGRSHLPSAIFWCSRMSHPSASILVKKVTGPLSRRRSGAA